MEKMPYRDSVSAAVVTAEHDAVVKSDWQHALPVLAGHQVLLRDLRATDAPSLLAMLTMAEVSRFISPPPTTVAGFERFIAWTHSQRTAGAYACFAVTLKGFDTAIGIFQLRQLESGFSVAEWGFAIGAAFWGSGIFQEGAELVLKFTFETLGVHRLEARAAVANGRGNGALLKMGAVQEGILHKSFFNNGTYVDQVLYAIMDEDWRAKRPARWPALVAVRVH
ncbi:MAG TPA: GNAT family protein [Vicinamibacterales bacterium]